MPPFRLSLLVSTFAALLLAAPAVAADGAGWVLSKRDTDAGWELFTRPEAGSAHPRYRLVAERPESVARVASAILLKANESRYTPAGWTVRVLDRGDDYFVNHVRMDVPVVSDRDVVIESHWVHDPVRDIFRMEWAPPRGELPPVEAGVTRIESQGYWEVTPLASGGSRLVYEQHSEIGSSIPRWLIDRMMDDQIVDELVAVERILENDLPAVATPPPVRSSTAATGPRLPSSASSLTD